MFRKLFGKDTPKLAAPVLPVVRNVTIGRTVVLDPLTWRRFGDQTHFTLDRDTLEITAQGVVSLDDGAYVHRFYTDDHVMFQAVSDDPKGESANDFTLFVPWRTGYPGSSAQNRLWADKLRSPTFMDDDLPVFRRFWFDEDTVDQAPVSFWENIFTDRDANTPWSRLFQTCMLFHRDLPDEGRELLLAMTLEPAKGDVTHEIMIGLPLAVGEFKA